MVVWEEVQSVVWEKVQSVACPGRTCLCNLLHRRPVSRCHRRDHRDTPRKFLQHWRHHRSYKTLPLRKEKQYRSRHSVVWEEVQLVAWEEAESAVVWEVVWEEVQSVAWEEVQSAAWEEIHRQSLDIFRPA